MFTFMKNINLMYHYVSAVTIGFVGEACLSVPESVMEEKEAKPKKPSSNKM